MSLGGSLPGPRIIELTSCTVDLGNHQILRDGQPIGLTPLEAGLLAALAEVPGQAVTRDELLHRVWGYRSGVVTRAVDKTVARLRGKLDADPDRPEHLMNVRGLGYRLDGITAVRLAEEPQARSPITNLRDWDVRSFVGRAEEGRLRELFALDTRLVSLLGPGGSGKTRLACRVGAELAASFAGGVWFVDLTEVRSADGLLAAVGQALGVPATSEDTDQRLQSALASRGRTLLVLDNAEQIVEHVAALLSRWTRSQRELRLLVTTRERLRIGGEVCLELEPLREDEALTLFLERAREAGAQVEANERALLVRLVTLLDRMPLALELAAARVRLLGLPELTERISRDLSVLRTGRRDVSEREGTLLGAIGWSWDLLSEEERCALCQAALFASGLSLAAAEAVLDTQEEPLALLEALSDKSMLRVTRDELGQQRFSLYESIRAFASSRAQGRVRGAPLALARFLAGELERLSLASSGRRGELAFRALLLERDNGLVGFELSRERHPDLAVRVALALQPVLAAAGPFAEAERLLSDAIALAEHSGEVSLRARALLARGATRSNLAALQGAREDLHAALALEPEPLLAAQIRSELGHVCRLQARTAEAFVHYEAALEVAPAEGHLPALLRERLGRLCANVGRLAEADHHLARALELARGLGHARLEAEVLLDLGWVAEARQDFATAIDLDEEALGLARLAGDRRLESLALLSIGTVQLESGAFVEGAGTLEAAARALAHVGDRRAQSIARCHEGVCRLALRDSPAALQAIHDALSLLDGVGDEVNVGVIETNLAEAHHLQGDLEAAREILERAVSRLRQGGVDALLGSALAHLAAVEADRDELARARERLAEAELALSRHPKKAELETLALRRLHLSLAEGDETAVRPALQSEPGEAVFSMLARRQLAGAWARRNCKPG